MSSYQQSTFVGPVAAESGAGATLLIDPIVIFVDTVVNVSLGAADAPPVLSTVLPAAAVVTLMTP